LRLVNLFYGQTLPAGALYPDISPRYLQANKPLGLNYPEASCGVSEFADKTSSSGVTPECFYRGSSLNFAWIPAKGMRE
jgi:hypothetical protein